MNWGVLKVGLEWDRAYATPYDTLDMEKKNKL